MALSLVTETPAREKQELLAAEENYIVSSLFYKKRQLKTLVQI